MRDAGHTRTKVASREIHKVSSHLRAQNSSCQTESPPTQPEPADGRGRQGHAEGPEQRADVTPELRMSQFVYRPQPVECLYRLLEAMTAENARNGAPGEIRTPDLLLRRQPLYPAELRAHARWIQFTCKPAVAVRTRYPELTGQGSLSGPWRCVDEPNRACRTDVVKRQPEITSH